MWETREFPDNHPYNSVLAMPNDAPLPPIWLLGSSDYSAQLSAQIGMGFAFAHHFASHDAVDALTHYRSHFKPSRWRDTPHGILAIAVMAILLFLPADIDKWDLHMLHWTAWERGIKSLYYCRSKSISRAGFAGQLEKKGGSKAVAVEKTDYEECLACQ